MAEKQKPGRKEPRKQGRSSNGGTAGFDSWLENKLRTIFEQRKDKTMFIAGAPTLRYGEIVQVIDAAKGAGVEKVGIVTDGMRKEAGVAPKSD